MTNFPFSFKFTDIDRANSNCSSSASSPLVAGASFDGGFARRAFLKGTTDTNNCISWAGLFQFNVKRPRLVLSRTMSRGVVFPGSTGIVTCNESAIKPDSHGDVSQLFASNRGQPSAFARSIRNFD